MSTKQTIHEAYAESKKKPLKLFVWEDVIPDYTDGCFVVLAASVEEAREQLRARFIKDCGGVSETVEIDIASEPKYVIDCTEPFVFYILRVGQLHYQWGGS